MASTVEIMAERFAQVALSFRTLAEQLDDLAWREYASSDRRPLGTIVHHVALGNAIGLLRIVAASGGYPQPLQAGTAAERNAEHARSSSEPNREATLRLLTAGAAAVEAAIRGVREEQLDAEFSIGSTTRTLAQGIEAVIDHVREHEVTIRAATGRT